MDETVNKKTILVTGAGGALAQQVIRSLIPTHNVIAVDFRRRVRMFEGLSGFVGLPLDKRRLLLDTALLRTERATFTALRSSLP